MELEKIEKLEKSVNSLKNKLSRIYFLVQDTKGNPKASVKYIYDLALILSKKGYNSIIIHESQDYKGVSSWLSEEYMELPHQTIDGQNLQISPEDFIIIPEIYGHVMEQLKNFTCGKIVLCQSYDYMLETLAPGTSWANFGFIKCITTSENQKKYITDIFRNVSVDIIEPTISSIFNKKERPANPIISIHSREQRDTAKIIKTFYLKYPQFRWLTFRDMRGISQNDFSKFLKESYLSVWVDDISSFGTFPLESMSSGTPVIGKVPYLPHEWMTENNGIWTNNTNDIVDYIANFTQNWLEDNIADNLYEEIKNTSDKFKDIEKFEGEVVKLFEKYFETRLEIFEEQLEKIKLNVEN